MVKCDMCPEIVQDRKELEFHIIIDHTQTDKAKSKKLKANANKEPQNPDGKHELEPPPSIHKRSQQLNDRTPSGGDKSVPNPLEHESTQIEHKKI